MVVGSISPNTRLGGESCPHERISRKGQQHGVSVSHVRAQGPQMLCSRGRASCEPLARLPSYVRGIWRHKHRQGHRKTKPPPPLLTYLSGQLIAQNGPHNSGKSQRKKVSIERCHGDKICCSAVGCVCGCGTHPGVYTHSPLSSTSS